MVDNVKVRGWMRLILCKRRLGRPYESLQSIDDCCWAWFCPPRVHFLLVPLCEFLLVWHWSWSTEILWLLSESTNAILTWTPVFWIYDKFPLHFQVGWGGWYDPEFGSMDWRCWIKLATWFGLCEMTGKYRNGVWSRQLSLSWSPLSWFTFYTARSFYKKLIAVAKSSDCRLPGV